MSKSKGATRQLRFDFFAVEIIDKEGSRIAAIALESSGLQVFVETWNRITQDVGSRAVIHPISAAIRTASPKSRSA